MSNINFDGKIGGANSPDDSLYKPKSLAREVDKIVYAAKLKFYEWLMAHKSSPDFIKKEFEAESQKIGKQMKRQLDALFHKIHDKGLDKQLKKVAWDKYEEYVNKLAKLGGLTGVIPIIPQPHMLVDDPALDKIIEIWEKFNDSAKYIYGQFQFIENSIIDSSSQLEDLIKQMKLIKNQQQKNKSDGLIAQSQELISQLKASKEKLQSIYDNTEKIEELTGQLYDNIKTNSKKPDSNIDQMQRYLKGAQDNQAQVMSLAKNYNNNVKSIQFNMAECKKLLTKHNVGSEKESSTSFSSYVGSKDDNWKEVIGNMSIHNGEQINVTFGNFDGKVPPHLEAIIDSLRKKINEEGVSAKIKISFGDEAHPISPYLKSKEDAHNLADMIAHIIQKHEVDGVDLDLEDNAMNPAYAADFIKSLREKIGAGKIISLTIPGQCWDSVWSKLIPNITNDVDSFTFMESPLWVAKGNTPVKQVKWDMKYYMQHFHVTKGQINIGLNLDLPDHKGLGHNWSVPEIREVVQWAKDQNFGGIMTGQSNKDYADHIVNILFPNG